MDEKLTREDVFMDTGNTVDISDVDAVNSVLKTESYVKERIETLQDMDPKDVYEFLMFMSTRSNKRLEFDLKDAASLLLTNKVKSPYVRLKRLRKTFDSIVNEASFLANVLDVCIKFMGQMNNGKPGRGNKRWTDEEDALLVDLVANGTPDVLVSNVMGRSVSSCKTRVSKLVGIGRITQDVAGYFIGSIDGDHIEGKIDGTVTKGDDYDDLNIV